MKIIPFTRPTLSTEEKKEVLKTLSSDWLTSAEKVATFEKMLSAYIGCKFVRVLNSCTSALNLAVLSCGLKKGDEVITTPFTFCATVNAIIHSGAKPVFADIDKGTFNISPEEIEKKITKRTKAILVMHYGGLPCNMERISSIAKRYKLKVIEDAAHAIGAEYKGRKIGTFSDVTCFSFHATKNMTTGEGGAIVTNRRNIINFVNKAYFHGVDKQGWQRQKTGGWQYRVIYPGFKYNMSDVLAAIGIQQLRKLDYFIEKRTKIALAYNAAFKNSEYIRTQGIPYQLRHAYYLYPLLFNIAKLKINRAQFIEELKKKGIIASVHFIPIYKHPAYKYLFNRKEVKSLKNTEYVYNHLVSLPIYPKLSLEDAQYIATTVKQILKTVRK